MKIKGSDPDSLEESSLAEDRSERRFSDSDESESENLDDQEVILKRARRLAKLARENPSGLDEVALNDSILLDHEMNKSKSNFTPHDKLLKALQSQELDKAMDYLQSK
jgi:hypothetical protein